MISRTLLTRYLEPTLGQPKYSRQGFRFNCPNPECSCDANGVQMNKYNLEINLDRNIFNCWSCRYSGTIRKLMRDHASDTTWRNLPEFKVEAKEGEEEEKPINYPVNTVPFFMNKEVEEYLIRTRGMDRHELIRRNVSYVFSKEEQFYNHICFPFYKDGILKGACLQNFETKKYKNLGKFDFVPYEEFLNPAYPVTVSEGNYDALSGINSTLLRGTEIFKAMLEYLRGKKVILALDNKYELEHYMKVLKAIEGAEPDGLVLFDLKNYGDMNEYYLNDPKGFFKEYRECFNDLKN